MTTRQAGTPQQTLGGAIGQSLTQGQPPVAETPEIFISPRVIDRRAYGELAGELRDMIERAVAERLALTAALDQAGKAARDLREREMAQQSNFELTLRAMKSIDEKAAKIEQLIANAANQSKVFETLEAKAGGLIETKLNMLDARTLAITSAATSKTEALEERVRQASRELEQRIDAIRRDAQSISAPVHDGLLKLCERATALINAGEGGGLKELVSRAEGVRDAAGEIVQRLEEVQSRAERGRESIETWSKEAEQRIGQLSARTHELESRTQDIIAQAERNLEIVKSTVTRQQAEAADRAQQSIDRLQATIEQLQVLGNTVGADGERVLQEIRPQADAAILELRRAVEQAKDATSSSGVAMRLLDKSTTQVKDLLARLEPWRGVLDGDPAALPEPLERMIHGVKSELGTIASALRGAAERAERAAGEPLTPRPNNGPVAPTPRRTDANHGAD